MPRQPRAEDFLRKPLCAADEHVWHAIYRRGYGSQRPNRRGYPTDGSRCHTCGVATDKRVTELREAQRVGK